LYSRTFPEDHHRTKGCVNTQNHRHGKFIFKRIGTTAVVQNKTRILEFGFNTSVPKPHEKPRRRWKDLYLLGIPYAAVEVKDDYFEVRHPVVLSYYYHVN
jgi:hypothetical protein